MDVVARALTVYQQSTDGNLTDTQIEAAGDISLEAYAAENNDIALTTRSCVPINCTCANGDLDMSVCKSDQAEACSSCNAGFELQDQDCNECSAGFFKGSKGTEACAACECPAGNTMTCDSIQGSTCTECPAGHFKATGASGFPGLSETCTPCGVGEYQPNTGATECLEAPDVVGVLTSSLTGAIGLKCAPGYGGTPQYDAQSVYTGVHSLCRW